LFATVQQEVFAPGKGTHELDLIAVEDASVPETDEIKGILRLGLGMEGEECEEGGQKSEGPVGQERKGPGG